MMFRNSAAISARRKTVSPPAAHVGEDNEPYEDDSMVIMTMVMMMKT